MLHGEGPAIVAAGPGSGKTLCITRRLLYLILECNIPPQEILVITFTKEAAKTMQERFYNELQSLTEGYKNYGGYINFGTFHSFFYQIIKNIKKYSEYQLITQQEKVRIVREILKDETTKEVSQNSIKEFLSQVSLYKNTGKFASKYYETEEHLRLLENMTQYERKKHTYKRLDFDDMLFICYKELSGDRELLTYWQKRFSYILVDEFQDINLLQYKLLCLLCIPPYNLFVVGDDDQAIYGFRGSTTGIFQLFQKDFPDTKLICLVQNYRCKERIVKASKRLIEQNKKRVGKELVSAVNNGSKGQIRVYKGGQSKACYENIICKLQKYNAEQLNEAAVLFRTNASLQKFAVCLAMQGIPFVIREKITSVYEHFVVKDILDYFYAAGGNCERRLYFRIFIRLGIGISRETLRCETVNIKKLKEIYRQGFYKNPRTVSELETLEKKLKQLSGMRPALGIKFILHAMDYKKYLLQKSQNSRELLEEWNHIIEWLTEDACQFRTFSEWLNHQDYYAKELAKQYSLLSKEKKGIHLLTLHASKGLEFQRVYIMNVNEGILPQYSKGELLSEERLEEERRLFYVGMTRAKEELELYYVTGSKEHPKFKSRFLEELNE